MYPDSRTLPDPSLTYNTLSCLFRGLGLSTDVRASVVRACRRISQQNDRGNVGGGFSPYNPGAAPSLRSLKRELDKPDSPLHQVLTRREVQACRTFVLVREAVGAPKITSEPSKFAPRRPGLHNWGGLNPTGHLPSSRGGWS